MRQSMPSSSIDSCAGVSDTCEQTKRPFSSRSAKRHSPWPSKDRIFDQVTTFTAKNELVVEGVMSEMLLHLRCRAVEAAAHVGVPAGEPDAYIGRQRESDDRLLPHRSALRPDHPRSTVTTRHSAVRLTPPPTRTRLPSGKTISIVSF